MRRSGKWHNASQSPTWYEPAGCASSATLHERTQQKFIVVLYRLQCRNHHHSGSDLREAKLDMATSGRGRRPSEELRHPYHLAEGGWPKGMASRRGHSSICAGVGYEERRESTISFIWPCVSVLVYKRQPHTAAANWTIKCPWNDLETSLVCVGFVQELRWHGAGLPEASCAATRQRHVTWLSWDKSALCRGDHCRTHPRL